MTRRWIDERGSVSTEMAVVMVAFFAGFLMLVVFAGRVAQAENDVRSAAHQAARAASLTGDPTRAESEARRVVDANLTSSGLSCRNGLDGPWDHRIIAFLPRAVPSRPATSSPAPARWRSRVIWR